MRPARGEGAAAPPPSPADTFTLDAGHRLNPRDWDRIVEEIRAAAAPGFRAVPSLFGRGRLPISVRGLKPGGR
jgi:hypothetical protein